MDQGIGQGGNGTDCGRRKQQSGVVDGLAPDSLFPPVIHMAGSRRRQAPEAVVWRSTGARQQFPVPQHRNQLRRRRRKRIESALRLQKAATGQPGEGMRHPHQAGRVRAGGQPRRNAPRLLRRPWGHGGCISPRWAAANCSMWTSALANAVTQGMLLGLLPVPNPANSRFRKPDHAKRLPPVTLQSRAAAFSG